MRKRQFLDCSLGLLAEQGWRQPRRHALELDQQEHGGLVTERAGEMAFAVLRFLRVLIDSARDLALPISTCRCRPVRYGFSERPPARSVKIFFDNCTTPVLASTLNGFVAHLGRPQRSSYR